MLKALEASTRYGKAPGVDNITTEILKGVGKL